jgi:predicted DsbA family dithiol-disulfide isomerase
MYRVVSARSVYTLQQRIMFLPIHITCVVDFMCPWSFIGIRSLELAMKAHPEPDIDVQLIPFEFDLPGTYPPEGTDWTEYCQSYGPSKAKFLLEEKLPRAFLLGRRVGINFDIGRRIVHTETVNAALMLVQEETGDGNNNAMEFALKLLHRHFEELEDPSDHEFLRSLFQEVNVDSQRMDSFFQDTKSNTAARNNEEWTRQGRSLGAPPVPLFIVTCGDDPENLCQRLPINGGGPTSAEDFVQLFQMCQEQEPDEL